MMYGLRVRIVEDCRDVEDKATGRFGTIIGEEPVEILGVVSHTPKIQLDNSDILYGCECWWDTVLDNDPPLEKAQIGLQEYKLKFIEVIKESLGVRNE